MSKQLLISCDLSWAPNENLSAFKVLSDFEKIIVVPLGGDLDDLDLTRVTHWITDPAPNYFITLDMVRSQLPNLRWLGSPSTGTTHISRDITAKDLIIRCLRDVNPAKLNQITSSSEHTFFLFMSLVRKSWNCLSCDTSGWRGDLGKFRGAQISNMNILIFGGGRIGSNVTRYLVAFAATVFIYDPDPLVETPSGACRVNMDVVFELLPKIDAVFLCFHWSVENTKFFSKPMLESLASDAFFINTSRGENVDEDALADLIADGKFRGVALDVIAGEQSEDFPNSRLLELQRITERLLITPHVAGASYDSEKLAFKFVCELLLNDEDTFTRS